MENSSQDSPQPVLVEEEGTSPHDHHLHPEFDSLIENSLGDFSYSQLLQSILVLLSRFFDAQQTFISIYTDAEPITRHGPRTDAAKTIISDWNLESASSFVKGLPTSFFFMGCLVGGFALATLADSSLGRKNQLILSCLTMSIAALMSIVSPNVWIYSVLRFISGFGRASIGASALVLSTEKIGSQWRGQMGTIAGISFALGLLSLPGIAYIHRYSSWRSIYIWTSTPTILYCVLVHFLVLESPRWLFLHDRKEEAIATLKRLQSRKYDDLDLSVSFISINKEASKPTLCSSIFNLMERKWALQRLLIVMLTGFGIGMVYYSLPFAVGNLGFDVYLTIVFNALSEIPAYIIFSIIIRKWNRKGSLIAFTTLSGICSILCVINWKGINLVLELVSYLSACIAFIMLMIYTLELFPTCVRNTASSLVRQALVFGAVFSPILVSAGRRNKNLSYVIFGIMSLSCSVFVVHLPETKNAILCDTMDEQEAKDGVKE